jgi:ribokinase
VSPHIVAIGSINMDIQVRSDAQLQPGSTLLGRDLLRAGGGKAANRAFMACSLGMSAQLFGCVGDDDLAGPALAVVLTRGVNVKHVRRVAGHNTGLSLIVVGPDGDKAIVLAPNANDAWEAQDVEQLRHTVAGAPSGSVVSLDLEIPQPAAVAAAAAAHARGLTLVIDPSPSTRMCPELFDLVDYLTPNPKEAESLSGIAVQDCESGLAAARKLCELGARHACVKLPQGGCALASGSLESIVVAPQVAIVDKTGAGDAFAGALAAALLEGLPPLAAARWATAASCLAVGSYGSQADFIDRARLEEMLARTQVRSTRSELTRP